MGIPNATKRAIKLYAYKKNFKDVISCIPQFESDQDIFISTRFAMETLQEMASAFPDEFKAAKIEKKLAGYLQNKDRTVRNTVVRLLDSLNWQPSNDSEASDYLIAKEEWGKLGKNDKSITKKLIKYLSDEDVDFRINIINTIGDIGDQKIMETLICHANADYWSGERDKYIDFCYSSETYPFIARALGKLGKLNVDKLIKLLVYSYSISIPVMWALCEKGDNRAREPIVNWFFREGGKGYSDNGITSISVALFLKRNIPVDILKGFLGPYGELLLETLAWKVSDSEHVNTDECSEAISKLCEYKTPASNNILNILSKIVQINVDTAIGSYMKQITYFSFEKQRQLALKELANRGNPRFDRKIFENQLMWQF